MSDCNCPKNGHGHAAWCERNPAPVPAAPAPSCAACGHAEHTQGRCVTCRESGIVASPCVNLIPAAPAPEATREAECPFTDAHARAIGVACEKLWNGEPAHDPICGPRPKNHPLYRVGSAAHKALNAAEALKAEWEEQHATIAAQARENETLRADKARLDWLEQHARWSLHNGCVTFGIPREWVGLNTEPTIRATIDAALAARAPEPQP